MMVTKNPMTKTATPDPQPVVKRTVPNPQPMVKKPVTHYAKVDGDGNILGFYLSSIHAVIPPGVVKITEAQYTQFFVGQHASPQTRYRLVDGVLKDVNPSA